LRIGLTACGIQLAPIQLLGFLLVPGGKLVGSLNF
jgi:hypothetical protein